MAIKEKEAGCLDEFWEIISPIGEFITSIDAPVFRGQANSIWNLTPSVLRRNIFEKYNKNRIKSHTDQIILFEFLILKDFLYYLDNAGIIVPGDSAEFRKEFDFYKVADSFGIDGENWPPEEFFPLIALAQHHGMPTRLLDWSKNSIVAAYFAASQFLNESTAVDDNSKLAVWVLDLSDLRFFHDSLQVVKLPGSTSNNLAAQKGLFIIHRKKYGVGRNDEFLPEDICSDVDDLIINSNECNVQKVTLPTKFAGDLLLRCEKFGISAATLFPGVDGAVKAALEYKLAKNLSGIL